MVETDLPAIWGHAAGSRKSLTLLRFDSFRYLTARLTLPGGLRQLGQDQHQQSSENLKHQNTVTENTAKDPKQYASFSFVPLMSLLRRCLYLLKYTMKNSLNGKKSVFHLLLNSHTYFLKCIAKNPNTDQDQCVSQYVMYNSSLTERLHDCFSTAVTSWSVPLHSYAGR